VVRSVETQALAALRRILTGITRKKVVRAECTLPGDVAMYLLNRKRAELQDFEARHGVRIIIQAGASMRPGEQKIELLDHN
jgi:ribonuclease E